MLVFILLAVVVVSGIAWVAALALGHEWSTALFFILVASLFLFRLLLSYLGSDARPKRSEPANILIRMLLYNPFHDWESGGEEETAPGPAAETDAPDDERRVPRAAGAATAHAYRCPRCGSGTVVLDDSRPNSAGAGEGFIVGRLRALARRAGSAWGNRTCRDCGHRW